MHLQRIVLPSGHVTWTAYDGDAIVTEIREFVISLEARHHAPSTVAHYARHVVRLRNYLAALGKSFREITPLDLDRFIPALIRHGPILDLKTALTIIPLRPEHVDVSASLHNQILFAVKAFYTFLDMRHAALMIAAGANVKAISTFHGQTEHRDHTRPVRPPPSRCKTSCALAGSAPSEAGRWVPLHGELRRARGVPFLERRLAHVQHLTAGSR